MIDVIKYIAEQKFDIKIDTSYFNKPTTNNYCGMQDGNFILTPEGMITPCVEIGRISDPYSDQLMIGKVSENNVKINTVNKDFLKELTYINQKGGCNICNLRLICLGGCPMGNIWENGLPLEKSKYTCSVQKIFLPEILSFINEDESIINVIMEDPSLHEGKMSV